MYGPPLSVAHPAVDPENLQWISHEHKLYPLLCCYYHQPDRDLAEWAALIPLIPTVARRPLRSWTRQAPGVPSPTEVWLDYTYADKSLFKALINDHGYTRSGAHNHKNRGRLRQVLNIDPCIEVDECSPVFAEHPEPGNPYTGTGPARCDRCGRIEVRMRDPENGLLRAQLRA